MAIRIVYKDIMLFTVKYCHIKFPFFCVITTGILLVTG